MKLRENPKLRAIWWCSNDAVTISHENLFSTLTFKNFPILFHVFHFSSSSLNTTQHWNLLFPFKKNFFRNAMNVLLQRPQEVKHFLVSRLVSRSFESQKICLTGSSCSDKRRVLPLNALCCQNMVLDHIRRERKRMFFLTSWNWVHSRV